ncbi:MAG: AraC family transcriptional regulator [Saprospiraceae bacterium]
MAEIFREITPINQFDCFLVFERHKKDFDFPIHTHDEMELNFIFNGAGVLRVVGDHKEEIGDLELVLVGTRLPHCWLTHNYQYTQEKGEMFEITIQFHKDLLDEKFLRRNQLIFIKSLLEKAGRGISFPKETIAQLEPRLRKLSKLSGFDSVLELFSILHDLSLTRGVQLLSNESFAEEKPSFVNRRVELVYDHIRSNYHKQITLSEISKMVGMTEVSFSRFFKKTTCKTFVESINDIRLGNASRMLMDSSYSISEIAFKCGFKNQSYFNRLFKEKKGETPKEFRERYQGTRMFV